MSENMVKLTIDGVEVEVPAGSTVLDAARVAGVRIPTLCYLKDVNAIGSCRMCVVEVKGARSLMAACVYPVNEGMEVHTATPAVLKSRRMSMELILSNHRRACLTCERNRDCELRTLAAELGIDEVRFQGDNKLPDLDESAVHLVRDNSKCILCRRCVATCRKNQEVGVITASDRGFKTHIESPFGRSLAEVNCVHCGQCVAACPTGALQLRRQIDDVRAALADPDKVVIAMPAPAVRVGLGERFDMPLGTNVEGRLVTACKRLGFDHVFDVDWGADMTIMEEGTELIERLKTGGTMPMFTSCCPAWVKYCEYQHPELLENLSSCRSPQQMTGGAIKTWWAEREGVDPENIVVVSIMPCTAKKFEITREEQRLANGLLPVDFSLTTRELGDMVVESGIMLDKIPDTPFDPILGDSTGAAVIFGASGGVMEAALRTAAVILSGEGADVPLEFYECRGLEGVREATYRVGEADLRIAVASGLAAAERMLKAMEAGEVSYDFVEVMTCPAGCINGAGQPIHSAFEKACTNIPAERAAGIYRTDENMPRRRSLENPEVMQAYEEYFEGPGAHRAHEVFHTSYAARDKYPV